MASSWWSDLMNDGRVASVLPRFEYDVQYVLSDWFGPSNLFVWLSLLFFYYIGELSMVHH